MTRRTPKVGEVLYKVPKDKRFNREGYVEVIKVGRKYFFAKDVNCQYAADRYKIENWAQDDGKYSPSSELWENKEDYEQYLFSKKCEKELQQILFKLTPQQKIELYNKAKEMDKSNEKY